MRLACLITLFLGLHVLAETAPDLAGAWEQTNADNPLGKLVFTLRPDGHGVFDGEPVKWRCESSKLILDFPDRSITFDFKLNAGILSLTGGSLSEPAEFVRPMDSAMNPPTTEPATQPATDSTP